jgi:hypothetical protein
MEAASRPSREPLSDLPVEKPADTAPASAAPAAASKPAPAAAPKPTESAEGTQTLELMDPNLLLAASEAPAAAVQPAAPEGPQVLDVDPSAPLTLEDSFELDKMLSAPAAAPAPTPAASAAATSDDDSLLTLSGDDGPVPAKTATPASAKPAATSKAESASAAPASPAPTGPVLVPLAKRAGLTAAAQKLAAAAGTTPARNPPSAKPAKAADSGKPLATPAAAVVKPISPKAPAVSSATDAVPTVPAAGTTAPADAPSLASWANARAAAASTKTSASASPRPAVPTVKPAQSTAPEKTRPSTPPVPAPAASAPTPATATAAITLPSRGMDRDFIARNQVVERYLSGKLPIKAATDFERYCKDHPELLDEMGLPERVNAGLRLLEASGKPEPWQEGSRPLWQQPAVMIGGAVVAGVLAVALALVAAGSASKTHKILDLQRQVSERTLDPAASTRLIRLLPNRSGATNTPAITIGGGSEAMLADLRIDESRSPYKEFRVTIDRIDQGRVLVIDNLSKDSNGHLRVALNSSALGPGNYLFTIEGLTMRLEPQPDSWVTVGVAQR